MSLLTSAIPLPYRILAVLLLVIGLFGSGYFYGHHTASLACRAATEKTTIVADNKQNALEQFQVIETQKILPIETTKVVTIRQAGTQNQEAAAKLPDQCTLSDDWVSTYNQQVKQQ